MQRNKIHIILVAIVLMMSGLSLHSQMDFYVSPNAVVHISPDAVVRVNGNVIVDNNGTLTQQNNSSFYVTNNFQVIGTFTSSNGTTYFVGANNSTLSGAGTTTFYTLVLNKDLNTLMLMIDKSLTINNNLDITQGWFRLLNNAARTIDLFGNLNIASNGLFDASTTGVANHPFNFYGLFNNNGIIDFNTTGGNIILNLLGNTDINLTGTGSFDFFEVYVNKNSATNIVTFDKVFTAADNFLTLTQGEFRLTSNYSITNNFFKLSGSDYTIPENTAFILDNPNVTVAGQSVAGNGILRGKLHVKQGEFNLGGSGECNLVYDRPTGYSELDITGGTVNIRTAIYPENSSRLLRLSVANGNLNIGTGSSNSNNKPTLDIPNTNSILNFASGTLRIQRGNTNIGIDDVRLLVDNDTVATNSTLEINDLAAGQTIEINSTVPIGTFLVNANNSPSILLKNDLQVMGNATFNGNGSDVFNTQSYNLLLNANITNNFGSNDGFNNSTGRVIFNGNTDQDIGGSQNTAFNILQIDKTAGRVEVNTNARVNGSIRFISNSILDVNTNKITMAAGTRVYSDDGFTYQFDTFSDSMCVVVQNTSQLVGGSLEFELNPSETLPYEIHYPVTTEGVYTPMKIRLLPSGVSYGTNPKINLRQYAGEHPKVEVPNVSLKKYWIVKSNDLTVNNLGVEVVGIYDDNEVEGSEGSYQVLAYSPNYDDLDGYWRVNPGVSNYVNINTNLWYSQQTNFLDGDWTVGEQSAGQATYYARANGDYNDPNTWSRIYYNGTASTTAPNKRSDRVRIQDHIVSISDSVAAANIISVELGTEGRTNGTLQIESNHYVKGDTFKLEQNCKLFFAHEQGISMSPNQTGAIRTLVRSLSDNAVYVFWQGQNQVSGDGVPDLVQSIVIDKTSGSTVSMSKNIGIRDSLSIVDGILDLGTSSVNGYTPGRIFKMYDGEMIVRSSYPLNYTPPFLTAGRITFDGVGNATVPSETSTPGVAQYNNLKIAGASRAGNITLENFGKIRILGDFDISELNFANNTYRFFTSGSTVRFVKNGNQNISFIPNSPTDSVCQIQFFNLELINSGNKSIVGTSPYPFSINNQLILDSAVTFVQNNSNIEIQSHWTNLNGSIFQPTAGKFVSFFAPTNTFDLNITARDTIDNNFEDVIIRGAGNIKPLDNFVVSGNISILSGTNFIVNGVDLFLYGNWTNTGGTFTHTNSTAYFQGNTTQTMTRTSGNETFHNLVLRNPANLNTNGIGGATNGLIINNDLNLDFGRIDARDRFVQVGGAITRSGGGYINSGLRRNLPTGTTTLLYEVGYEEVYTPLTIYLNGSGGTAGIVQIKSDTITTSTSPISWTDATPTDINPSGSQISPEKHIARQWNITRPTGSTFALGSRKYDAVMHFIGLVPPSGDLRGGLNPFLVDAKVYNGTNWIGPLYYGTFPYIGTRENDSLEFKENIDLGTIVVGEPTVLTYYTKNSGNWKTISNWSTISYNGPTATSYPGQLGPNFRALVGASHQITLDTNLVVNNTPTNACIVTVDSSGVLDLNTSTISGTGEFRLFKYGTIRIGHTDGITASSATGNIRTTTRSYNFNNYNLGTFVYNGTGAQNTGDGLPSGTDSIRVLIINKPVGTTVTLNASSNISIKDSLFVQSGTFNSGNRDITLIGNMRQAATGTFAHNNRTFIIAGAKGDTLSAESYGNPITFHNLTISKLSFTGSTVLDNSTFITINNQLTFSGTNRSFIDAITKSNQTTPNYVLLGASATVIGAQQFNTSQPGGWIYGRLHKNVPAGDSPNIIFEIGDYAYYSPLEIDFRAGSGSTAGYLMAQPEFGFHPRLYDNPSTLYPVNPNRVILSRWKLVKPFGSTFVRGARNFDPTVRFPHPQYTTILDCVGCADLTYYRGGDSLQWWQTMTRNNTTDNSGTQNVCGDTRIPPHPTPTFNYNGSTCTTPNQPTSWIRVLDLNTSFGIDEIYANGDTLLAEFVAGNRNSVRYYNFYSIADGDWTDPNTWSTVSFSSTVNEALLDPDQNVFPFPVRQYDNALIGNGKTVRLNSDIGHNNYNTPIHRYTHAGPSVKVYETGTIDFGTRTLRGNGFSLFKGGKIIIGAQTGISNAGTGNIILGSGNNPSFADSANFVYSAVGQNVTAGNWGFIDRNASTHFIESVTIRRASDNAIIMQSITGNRRTYNNNSHNYIWNRTADLAAGVTYYLQINPSNVVTNRRYKGWINFNYGNNNFTEGGETIYDVNSNDTILVTTTYFTIPAGIEPGTTHLRIGIRDNITDYQPTNSGTGEFEEYTINIINPNPTIAQTVGAALPTKIASFEVNSSRPTSTVTLTKNIEVNDSVKVSSGTFLPGSNLIRINGAFIIDTVGGFNPQTSTVEFFGEFRDSIRTKIPNFTVPFYNLTINKAFQDSSIFISNTNISISNTFNWNSNNNIVLADNYSITHLNTSTLTGLFSKNRMVRISGTTNSGQVIRQFTNTGGLANPKTFTFPIGIDTNYYPVYIRDTAATWSGTPEMRVSIVGDQHPQKLSNNTLNIYWKTRFANWNTNVDTLKFTYRSSNITGDTNKYIPAYWDGSNWKIDLGMQPWAKSSPITIKNTRHFEAATPTNFAEWTAGQPQTFSTGRKFYSRNTGQWGNYVNWSSDTVLKHAGLASSYFPGDLFESDTVHIDGHTITFSLDSCRIDSLLIGGTNPSGIAGILEFANTTAGKKLFTRQVALDADNGLITPISAGTNIDSLIIIKDLTNNSVSPGGFDFVNGSHAIAVKFVDSGNSAISGNGVWQDINRIVLQKTGGLADSLLLNSTSFATASLGFNPNFVPISGVIKSTSGLATRIASASNDLSLQPNSGIHTFNGGIIADRNLLAGSGSKIQLDKGNLQIGSAADRNFIYSTGSQIIINDAQMSVAGGFLRSVPTATTNLSINDPNSAVIAGRIGYTGIDPTFDLQNSGSVLNMNTGRIIVVTGNTNSTSDIDISASGGIGITGGDIQLGDSTLAISAHPFKFSGSTPIYNLHLVNDAAETANFVSRLASLEYLVKNDIIVDKKQDFNLNGNTLTLQGNLIVHGKVTATPSSPSSLSWRMILNGLNDQSIRNYNSSQQAIEIFSLRVAKNTGNVILGGGGSTHSNLKINDHLEFLNSNNAFIDSRTNNFKVVVGPNSANLGIYQISRPNLGHIDGTLSRFVPNGAQSVDYQIGLDTIGAYRPVRIVTTGNSNTAGYVSSIVYPDNHPDIANSALLPATNVPRYWAVNRDTEFGAFNLGTGGRYQITTTFKNPDDVPNPPSLSLFEHRLYSPSYPPSAGTWSTPSFLSSNSTSVTSNNLNIWGDFVVGEPNTVTFYSIQDGNWQDISTWSLSGYTVPNPPTRIPNLNTDIVRIGNGRTVILLDDASYPNVRNIIVETYNGNPGYLQVNGQFNYVRGLIFQLDDDNTLGIQHVDGLRPISDGNVGAIQTNSRNFGVSRYIFNSAISNQITGTAIPNYVKSIIVDNSSPNANKKVFLSNFPGAPQVNVIDSLFVRQGVFNFGNRNIRLLGQFVIDSIFNDGKTEPLSSKLILDSNTSKNIVIRNRSGVNLFDLQLVNGGIVDVKREGSKVTRQSHLNISGTLEFSSPYIVNLGDSTNINITNTDINAILNFATDKFIRTSRTSGSLVRSFSNTGLPKTYTFPIGSFEGGNNYARAEVTISSMAATGRLGVRTSPGDYGGFPGGHARLSSSMNAEYLKRYWTIDSVTSNFNGLVRFYYNQPEVYGFEGNYTRLGRWNPVREQTGGVWTQYFNPTIDSLANYFQTTAGFSSADLTGDWTLGNLYAFRRIFFSRQNGNWNDPNSWTFSPTHSGPVYGPGQWPDNALDSAVIGGGNGGVLLPHEIVLNLNANIQGTALGTSPTNRGILNTNYNVLSGQYFTMGDYSHLKITSPDGITTVGNATGNIQTTDTRSYNTNFGIFEFNGNTNQTIGNGLPSTVWNLITNNTGPANNNIVTIDKNISIQNNLTITQGALNLNTYTANNINSAGLFSINANARLMVGGNNNLSLVISNYPTYNVDIDSYIEFSGNLNQQIDLLPPNLIIGLGNVDLTNSGIKIVDNPLLIRGNLSNFAPATLLINVVDALQVHKNVANHSAIINNGILEIGQ